MRKGYDFSQGKRGPVAPVQPGKVRITIRIDADILKWFREKVNEIGGGNYQTMMNDALRSYIQYQYKMLEETIRKVIREELRDHG
ncbi:MAG: BrnA antitoxin family protein [Thermodesulfobacteriota bacterium]